MTNIDKQPNLQAKIEYISTVEDIPTVVTIPGTRKKVKVSGTKPGTMRWLTRLWIERDIASARIDEGTEVLRDMCKEPVFSIKEACIMVLNSYWKLRFFYPIMWRWWAYVRQFTEWQMTPIIMEGKKKLPLTAHYENMVFSLDMREDVMMMTRKEAEQYRAGLLSAAKQRSSRTSRNSGGPDTSS